MEPDAILEIFQKAEELHVKYVNYMRDDDSKTYSKIVKQLPYDMQEKKNINHKREWGPDCKKSQKK